MSRFYLDYDEVYMEWCVYQTDAGSENGHFFDVMICGDEDKQVALYIRDALENFDKNLGDYL